MEYNGGARRWARWGKAKEDCWVDGWVRLGAILSYSKLFHPWDLVSKVPPHKLNIPVLGMATTWE